MWYNIHMSKLLDLEKELTEKQLKVIESNFDVEAVKEQYDVKDDETAELIIKSLREENRAVIDYIYTKDQIERVETELYMTATKEDTDSVKMKAIDSFLDRVKGRPLQKTDVTTKGGSLPAPILVQYIDGETTDT